MSNEKLMERNQQLLTSGSWCDCSFVVGTASKEKKIHAHKVFLASASPAFVAMFFGPMAQNDLIFVDDIEPETFTALLQYIYTYKTNLTSYEEASALYYAAKKYMLADLKTICQSYLLNNVNALNVCQAYEFGQLHDEKKLIDLCVEFIHHNTSAVLSTNTFENVTLDTLLMIFERDYLRINSEVELFGALSRYASKYLLNSNSVTKMVTHTLIKDSVISPEESKNPPKENACSYEDTDNSTNGQSIKYKETSVRDVIQKIRFLRLTPQEFANMPDQCNLLSVNEKFEIFMNLCSSDCKVSMPPGFSTSRTKRKC